MKARTLYILLLSSLLISCNTKTEESSSNMESADEISSQESIMSSSQSENDDSSSNSRPTRPHTHNYDTEEVIKEPTLFETGIVEITCSSCGDSYEEDIHKIDELAFNSKIYQYDGNEHELLLDGIIPATVSVVYSQNVAKEIGIYHPVAKLYDNQGKIVKELHADLTITNYIGFPSLNVNTNNEQIQSKEIYTTASFSMTNTVDKDYEFSDKSGGIRLRGNGTLEGEKKPYRLKFDKKINLLGLNDGAECKSWVLLADYYDYSMQRNKTALSIGSDLYNYSGNYSSGTAYVNLYINNIYNGVYVLAEQQQVNKYRVDIYEPEENETNEKIGYLVELDAYAPGEGDSFKVGDVNDTIGSIKIPSRDYGVKSDYYSNVQFNYISKYMNSVHKIFLEAIKGNYYTLDDNNNLVDSSFDNQYDTINNVIDLESLFKMYYIQEIMKSTDVGWSSFYLYVDFSENSKAKRLTFGAPWDFDWSSGNLSDSFVYNPVGGFNNQTFDHTNPWLLMLSRTSFFKEYFKKYYNLFDKSKIVAKAIADNLYITNCFDKEFAKNFTKWATLGRSMHIYHPNVVTTFKTHKDASDQFINWLNDRMSYMDSVYKEE